MWRTPRHGRHQDSEAWGNVGARAQGGNWNQRVGPVGQMSTRVGIGGGRCTLIFEQKSALNCDPWAKFQTFRHLSVLEVSIIIICKLLSSHLDKCMVTYCVISIILGHFNTTNISTGGGARAQGAAAPLPLSGAANAPWYCVITVILWFIVNVFAVIKMSVSEW